MPRTLYSRCPSCEYENNPEYRFCGMCGTALPWGATGAVNDRQASSRRESFRVDTPSELPSAKTFQAPRTETFQTDSRPEAAVLDLRDDSNKVVPARSDSAADTSFAEKASSPDEGWRPRLPSRDTREAFPTSPVIKDAHASAPVSGPSFLGLADEPRQNVSYLLEDEEPGGGRRRAAVFVLILVAAGSLLAWHWKRTGNIYPWQPGSRSAESAVASSSGPPIPAQNQTPQIEKNNIGAGDAQPVPPSDTKAANSAPPPSEHSQPEAAATGAQNAETIQNDDSAASGGKTGEPAKEGGSTPVPSVIASTKSHASVAEENSSQPAPPNENKRRAAPTRETAANAVSKASLRQAAPSATPENRDKADPLFIQGQRYLYGTGVRQNCDLAQKSLTTAAQNSNTQAESTLATMYATGHCVPRSLPLAYRWFAKASHQEPSNPRIDQDLEILWKQMTPEEKQFAIKNR